MLRKLVHKFWSRVLGIPMPQPRIPRTKMGNHHRERMERLQNKIHWKINDWELTEEVDHHMGHLRTASWWPAKWEAFNHINDEDDNWGAW